MWWRLHGWAAGLQAWNSRCCLVRGNRCFLPASEARSPLRLTYQTSAVTFPLRPSPCHTVLELNTTVWALREGRCNGEVWAWFLTTVRRKNCLEAKSQLPSIQADVCADGPACTVLWQRSPSYIMLLHFLQQAMQPHTRITFALWDSV